LYIRRKEEETEEKYIMRSLIICAADEILS
jgi:hypothetical protein